MDAKKVDAVVVGAGLGGLCAAAHLAKAGKKVLVLEHHTIPGGYAQEFRRERYRFDTALHFIDGVAPGGWTYDILAELGLLERLQFRRYDPLFVSSLGGMTLETPADHFAWEIRLIKQFPHQAKGIRSLFDACLRVYWDLRRMVYALRGAQEIDLSEIAQAYPAYMPAQVCTWSEFLGQHISDPLLKGFLNSGWLCYGLPASQISAANYILPTMSFGLFGAYYPAGGAMALSTAFANRIRELGGELIFRQDVVRIEIANGRARAVETAQGLRVEANLVVSNASWPSTMLDLVGAEHLPADYLARFAEHRSSLGSLFIQLGLKPGQEAAPWTHHGFSQCDDPDSDAQMAAVLAGDWKRVPFAMSDYGLMDANPVAPPGGDVVTIFTLAPWDYADQWGTGGNFEGYRKNPRYQEIKRAAADQLLERAERVRPGLRDRIKYLEIATPLTNRRYTKNPQGAIYGFEPSVATALAGLAGLTPIENLFLAGAWALAGGMSAAMLSGKVVAEPALAYLENQPYLGILSDFSALASQPAVLGETADHELETSVPPPPRDAEASAGTLTSQRAPGVTLKAIGSGRGVTLDAPGKPLVLICCGQGTQAEAERLGDRLGASQSDVLVASLVDLGGVPKVFHGLAEAAIKKAWSQACKALGTEVAVDRVIILPDWDGSVVSSLGLAKVDRLLATVVIDAQGVVQAKFQGSDRLDADTIAALGGLPVVEAGRH